MAELKLDWDGKVYRVDLSTVTSREYKTIKAHTGLRVGQFERALYRVNMDGVDAEVLDALLWLFRSRAGEQVDIGADDYSPSDLLDRLELIVDPAPEGPEVSADPKGSDGTPPSSSPSEAESTPNATTGTSGT